MMPTAENGGWKCTKALTCKPFNLETPEFQNFRILEFYPMALITDRALRIYIYIPKIVDFNWK